MSPLGRLYLVPLPLGLESDPGTVLPLATIEVAAGLKHFVAENARTARRLLGRLPLARPIQEIRFQELNEHTRPAELSGLLAPLLAGEDMGLVSEAGCPAIADPGSALVALAHAQLALRLQGDSRKTVVEFRKHLGWYTRGLPGSSALRERLFHVESMREAEAIFTQYLENAAVAV